VKLADESLHYSIDDRFLNLANSHRSKLRKIMRGPVQVLCYGFSREIQNAEVTEVASSIPNAFKKLNRNRAMCGIIVAAEEHCS
jgi:hypothetical protein